jgi:hypothetical protein
MKSETNFFEHTDFAPYSLLGLAVELHACPCADALAKAGMNTAQNQYAPGARNDGSDEPVEVNATSS